MVYAGIVHARFNCNTFLLSGYYTGEVHCYQWHSNERLRTYLGNTSAVFTIDHSDTHDLVISGSADFSIRLWKMWNAEPVAVLTGHSHWIDKVRITFCLVTRLRLCSMYWRCLSVGLPACLLPVKRGR